MHRRWGRLSGCASAAAPDTCVALGKLFQLSPLIFFTSETSTKQCLPENYVGGSGKCQWHRSVFTRVRSSGKLICVQTHWFVFVHLRGLESAPRQCFGCIWSCLSWCWQSPELAPPKSPVCQCSQLYLPRFWGMDPYPCRGPVIRELP